MVSTLTPAAKGAEQCLAHSRQVSTGLEQKCFSQALDKQVILIGTYQIEELLISTKLNMFVVRFVWAFKFYCTLWISKEKCTRRTVHSSLNFLHCGACVQGTWVSVSFGIRVRNEITAILMIGFCLAKPWALRLWLRVGGSPSPKQPTSSSWNRWVIPTCGGKGQCSGPIF